MAHTYKYDISYTLQPKYPPQLIVQNHKKGRKIKAQIKRWPRCVGRCGRWIDSDTFLPCGFICLGWVSAVLPGSQRPADTQPHTALMLLLLNTHKSAVT